ncbi:hypothetical protein [Pseudoalteromonas sp. S16_S37]|uniref:hypothetical protein n=1 Tax=Pseudoalteromonas sp. S16_S37 TaxID=2720228 RepID=UPI001680E860|nr:hypothetical protein [Pseudoalteromonas sp. S16_S37]MBD1584244.1 hypothetical protein [Pseudoalteromonas sp. S16_S37]
MQVYPKKVFKFLIVIAALVHLTGCEKAPVPEVISYQSAQQALQEINQALAPNQIERTLTVLPFTDEYLDRRHVIYQSLDKQALDKGQLDELNYLMIQERYPERYIMWPASVNVLKNALAKGFNEGDINNWFLHVIAKLEEAKESKIYLSRIELSRLKSYLSEQDKGNELTSYLDKYKPRSGIGLYQLPNGREWYQSKLNFYYTEALSPSSLLTQVQHRLADKFINAQKSAEHLSDENLNYALSVLKTHCQELKPGLNWQDAYVNLPATLASCQLSLTAQEQALMLALMEVDLGVHYQGWSLKQATVTLQSRLELTDQQAYSLIEGVALHPASVLTFLPKI